LFNEGEIKMARGWYGLEVGDKVEYPILNGKIIGIITELFVINKNGGIMKDENGNEIEIICERCKKLN
jgi:hypothetical protein